MRGFLGRALNQSNLHKMTRDERHFVAIVRTGLAAETVRRFAGSRSKLTA